MIIQGIGYWAKIVGKPQPGWKNQYLEWSFDLAIDEDTKQRLLDEGMHPKYINDKGGDRGEYITFRRKELKQDGTPSKPFAIMDHNRDPWDGQTLIGNGSRMNVKVVLNEIEDDVMKPAAIKIQVIELVPFEKEEDFPVYDDKGNEESWD